MTLHTTPLHVHTYGRGPARLAALHGWAGNHASFRYVASCLPEGVGLVAPDMPGHGRSSLLDPWTREELVATLCEGLEPHVQLPMTLIGNCSGALAALMLATERPDWVERLILIEPFAYMPWYFRVFMTPALGRLFYATAFENPLGRWIVDQTAGARNGEEGDLAASFDALDPRVPLLNLQMLSQMGQPDDYAQLALPIDLVYGSRTFAAVRESIDIWQEVGPSG
ncbi:MAG: alpha/beta hydrolase [Myxococcota bacterium]